MRQCLEPEPGAPAAAPVRPGEEARGLTQFPHRACPWSLTMLLDSLLCPKFCLKETSGRSQLYLLTGNPWLAASLLAGPPVHTSLPPSHIHSCQ